jgi:hypothetical protein
LYQREGGSTKCEGEEGYRQEGGERGGERRGRGRGGEGKRKEEAGARLTGGSREGEGKGREEGMRNKTSMIAIPKNLAILDFIIKTSESFN